MTGKVKLNRICLQNYISYRGIQTIETGIGVSTGTILQGLVTVSSSFLIGFIISWKLTAVTSSILAGMFILIFVVSQVSIIMYMLVDYFIV